MPGMSAAPIEPDGILAALRAHGESVMLPAAAYVGPDVYAWERRHVFAAGWTCLGRADDLLTPEVTHRAVEVGDVGVLLTAVDGRLRAYANVCRHRGHELLPTGDAAGHRAVVCPYHGWAYRLDGTLRTAPGMDGAGDGLDLVELPRADAGAPEPALPTGKQSKGGRRGSEHRSHEHHSRAASAARVSMRASGANPAWRARCHETAISGRAGSSPAGRTSGIFTDAPRHPPPQRDRVTKAGARSC